MRFRVSSSKGDYVSKMWGYQNIREAIQSTKASKTLLIFWLHFTQVKAQQNQTDPFQIGFQTTPNGIIYLYIIPRYNQIKSTYILVMH